MVFKTIIKRDGKEAPFQIKKIENAIEKAFIADGTSLSHNSYELAEAVVLFLKKANIERPHIEEIQDMVEKVLENLGYAGIADRYKKFREQRRLLRGQLFIANTKPEDYEEIYAPKVEVVSKGQNKRWDPWFIQRKLMDDFQLGTDTARQISSEVERKIFALGFASVSSQLVRELTNHVLRSNGLEHLTLNEERVGVPIQDMERLFFEGQTNAQGNNPERIRDVIANHSLKQFSLQNVFSHEIAEAHRVGQFHIHGLGYPATMFGGVCDIREIIQQGLSLQGLPTVSSPAKHARTLATHINTYLACMRPYYYGPISLAYLNIFFAPYLENISHQEMMQEAQNFIFITSQNAFTRGGEAFPIDFNIYTYLPNSILKLEAVGPAGKHTGKTYQELMPTILRFATALIECWACGDASRKPFVYPSITLHYQDGNQSTAEAKAILELANKIALRQENLYFAKEQEETYSFSALTCLTRPMKTHNTKGREFIRLNNLQTISINLPHILLKRGLDRVRETLQNLENEILVVLDKAVQAHEEKRMFMLQLSSSPTSPLKELQKNMADGFPVIDLHSIKCCIGFVGLHEFVKLAIGKSLDSIAGLDLAKKLLTYIHKCLKEVSLFPELYEIETNPELVAAYRLARRDNENYPQYQHFFKKDKEGSLSYSSGLEFLWEGEIYTHELLEKRLQFYACFGLHSPILSSKYLMQSSQNSQRLLL